jgi:multidrug efflux pump subunit AcrA (membrane-fusion protein)
MSGVVDVEIEKKSGVLRVPHEFVRKRGDEIFVVLKNGKERPIQVGLQNEEYFEIVSGLSEGEEVKASEFR